MLVVLYHFLRLEFQMDDLDLHSLFPTVVYRKPNAVVLTDEEENYLKNIPYIEQWLGNKISSDKFLLDNKELSRVKDELTTHLNVYLNKVMNIDNELYITNSWINITHKDQEHKVHNHTNSILSGVLYIQVADSQPYISFHRMDSPLLLTMKASEYHAANSNEWNIPLEDNDVIIFPSKMHHSVAPNRTDNPRISIAFNSFIRGTIGTDISGADLTLK